MEGIGPTKKKIWAAAHGNWSVIIEIEISEYPRTTESSPGGRSVWECFLWNHVTRKKINVPNYPDEPHDAFFDYVPFFENYLKCILSSDPTHPGCMVVFLHRVCKVLLLWLVGQDKWMTIDYEERFYAKPFLADAVACNGRLYGTTRKGRICECKIIPDDYPIMTLSHVPSHCPSKKLQLVDSCGALFVVSRKSVLDIEIHKYDVYVQINQGISHWKRIHYLGDRVFVLIGSYSKTLSAGEAGIKGNCIYFAEDLDDNTLYMYNLEDGSLSTLANGPEYGNLWFTRTEFMPKIWLPDQAIRITEAGKWEKESSTEIEEADEDTQTKESIWSKLPEELEIRIANLIPTGWGFVNFRAACSRLRSLVPPIEWKLDGTGQPLKYPWLMFPHKGFYHFYDPMCNMTYSTHINMFKPCRIQCSKDGWLLVSRGNSMVFFEPFTRETLELPDLPVIPESRCLTCISFSAPPTSPDCAVFVISHPSPRRICITYIRSSDEGWTSHTINTGKRFIPSVSNPIFWRQSLYCLGQDGSLGIFKLSGPNYSCCILDNPSLSGQLLKTSSRSFMVSRGEELILVCLSDLGELVRTYKVHTQTMQWEEVQSLTEGMLFLSQTSSVAVQTTDKAFKNTIQLPMFKGTTTCDNICYSFKTKRYHTRDRYSTNNLYGTREMLHGTWIQPMLTREIV